MSITVGSSTITVNSGAVMADPPGSTPLFFCRAWVSFNMQGTPAINGNGNVSSITDNGIGQFTVTFSTAMTDANYSTGYSIGNNSGFVADVAERHVLAGQSSSTVAVQCASYTAYVDSQIVGIAIFR